MAEGRTKRLRLNDYTAVKSTDITCGMRRQTEHFAGYNKVAMSGIKEGEFQKSPILREIVTRLIKAYRPDRVYLFGSKAREDSGSDSDSDLMVVVPDGFAAGAPAKPSGLSSSARHRHCRRRPGLDAPSI